MPDQELFLKWKYSISQTAQLMECSLTTAILIQPQVCSWAWSAKVPSIADVGELWVALSATQISNQLYEPPGIAL